MPVDVPVVLSGYGPVGQAYATELKSRGETLARQYGVRPYVAAVRRSRTECVVAQAGDAVDAGSASPPPPGVGSAFPPPPGLGPDSPPPLGPGSACPPTPGSGSTSPLSPGTGSASPPPPGPGAAEAALGPWRDAGDFGALLDAVRPAVFVQAVPSSADVTGVAAAEAEVALRRGVHLVTATKSHLLASWRELHEAGRAGGAGIRFSGATGSALPAGDVARYSMLGFECQAIRGCPNGTSTYILDRLAEGGDLDAAVADAQARGIAEADPTADLSGTDSATKVRLLTGLTWGWDVTAIRVRTEPIDATTAAAAQAAAKAGHRLRLVATARADTPGEVTVEQVATRPGDPLHAITGPEKAVVFDCGPAGEITISGGRGSPRGAALAMLKDTLATALEGPQ